MNIDIITQRIFDVNEYLISKHTNTFCKPTELGLEREQQQNVVADLQKKLATLQTDRNSLGEEVTSVR
jgi:hypothetical protein